MKPNGLPLAIDTDCRDYLDQRGTELHETLTTVNGLAGRGELPDASLADGVLKITPLTNAVPPEADALARKVSTMLPRIKITDLLVEVDVWTAFTQHFVHLRNGDTANRPHAPADRHPGRRDQPRAGPDGGCLPRHVPVAAELDRRLARPRRDL